MDGALNIRHARLLSKLKARTDRDGNPKRNYEQNVAAIRAELSILEERISAVNQLNAQDQG